MQRLLIFTIVLVSMSCLGQTSKQDSLSKLLDVKPVSEHAFLFNELASLKAAEDDYKTAIGFARKALELAQKFENTEEEYNALANIARSCYDIGNLDSSIYYGKKALEIAKQVRNPSMEARMFNRLGITYSRIPFYDKALSNYLLALKIVEDTMPNTSWERNQYYKSLLLNNIGIVYNKLSQTEKALEYFNKSLKIRREQNDLNGIATCLQNIGVIYEHYEDFDTTLFLYNEALMIRKTLKQKSYMAELLMNIGIVSITTKQYNVSETNLKEAILMFDEFENKRLLSFAHLNLAKLYMEMHQPETAYPYILESLKISELHGFRVIERDAYKLFADYYTSKNNYEKVSEYLNKHIAISDSIFNSETAEKVSEMQAKYETEKKEKEIEILTRDNEIQSLNIKRKTTQVYILVFVVILIILLLLITILLFNRKRLKQKQIKTELEKSKLLENKLKEENSYQSKQLTTHALNMLQKNKLLREMENEIKSFLPKADDPLKKNLNNIRRQINRNMNSEKDWDLFKLYFENVNENFYTTLQNKSNELTSGDLKLAALIKLNLNIKEAAAVLNISPDSLRKARYRLRKKLGLYDRENLSDYLGRVT